MTFKDRLQSFVSKNCRIYVKNKPGFMKCQLKEVGEDCAIFRVFVPDKLKKKVEITLEGVLMRLENIEEIWEDPRDLPPESTPKILSLL